MRRGEGGGGSAHRERREVWSVGLKSHLGQRRQRWFPSSKKEKERKKNGFGSSHLDGGSVVATETLKGCSCDGCTSHAFRMSRGWLILGWSSFHQGCPVKVEGTSFKCNIRVRFISLFHWRPHSAKLVVMGQKNEPSSIFFTPSTCGYLPMKWNACSRSGYFSRHFVFLPESQYVTLSYFVMYVVSTSFWHIYLCEEKGFHLSAELNEENTIVVATKERIHMWSPLPKILIH